MSNDNATYLKRLKAQHEKLKARIHAIEAREKTAERKRDIRRKMLVGSFYLEQAEKNNTFSELQQALDGFLTRESDRALFGLPPLNAMA